MRRLSLGSSSNFLGAFVDEEDTTVDIVTDIPVSSRRTSASSRRSSFRSVQGVDGKTPQQSSLEQARIAEMYKVVIKMSAENVRPFNQPISA